MDPAEGPSGERPVHLSILTYNAGLFRAPVSRFDPVPHVDARLAVLPSAILGMDVDVVTLQEVYRDRDREALLAAVRARYPHVGHVPKTGYALHGGQLTLSRHPMRTRLERFRTGPLTERLLAEKGALVSEIALPDGREVTMVNLHHTAGGLLALPESPRAEAMRAVQIDQVLALASGARGLVLLAGDFNAGPGVADRNYQQLRRAGYVDLYGMQNEGSAACTWDPANPLNRVGPHRSCPPQRIDHLFARRADLDAGRVRPVSSRVVLDESSVTVAGGRRVTPSDHYGLRCEIALG